jgi:hypothetical protein
VHYHDSDEIRAGSKVKHPVSVLACFDMKELLENDLRSDNAMLPVCEGNDKVEVISIPIS